MIFAGMKFVKEVAVAVDPAAAGLTQAALLRGILAELKAQTVLLQDIKTNTTVP